MTPYLRDKALFDQMLEPNELRLDLRLDLLNEAWSRPSPDRKSYFQQHAIFGLGAVSGLMLVIAGLYSMPWWGWASYIVGAIGVLWIICSAILTIILFQHR